MGEGLGLELVLVSGAALRFLGRCFCVQACLESSCKLAALAPGEVSVGTCACLDVQSSVPAMRFCGFGAALPVIGNMMVGASVHGERPQTISAAGTFDPC